MVMNRLMLLLLTIAILIMGIGIGKANTIQEAAGDALEGPGSFSGMTSYQIMRNDEKVINLAILGKQYSDFLVGGEYLYKGDYESAFNELKPLANQGYQPAVKIVAWMFTYGHGVEKNEAESLRWYNKETAMIDYNKWVVSDLY